MASSWQPGVLILKLALDISFRFSKTFRGYALARAARLDKNSARSIALEVGIQNGGMASGIAGAAGTLGPLGLAAAIGGPSRVTAPPSHPDRPGSALAFSSPKA